MQWTGGCGKNLRYAGTVECDRGSIAVDGQSTRAFSRLLQLFRRNGTAEEVAREVEGFVLLKNQKSVFVHLQ